MKSVFYAMLVAFFIGACSLREQTPTNAESHQPSSQSNSDSATVITLPSPMQIPALLYSSRATYSPEHLAPLKLPRRSVTDEAIVLGIHLVDLGYTAGYGDRTKSVEFFDACAARAEPLGWSDAVNRDLRKRFLKNIHRHDSLGRIVLELYDLGHQQLLAKNQEGLGLIVVVGCFFESLHLSLANIRHHDRILFIHALNQHKLYSANIIRALRDYEIPDEMGRYYALLLRTQELLTELDPPSIYDVKTGKRSVNDLNAEVLQQIQDLSAEFRSTALD